ncbi:hypothetical protein CP532_0605 [Ophiocordyceps camponoti-leonardi (nom. inval.)]|nr:hypothetical protein CP532_0605 [Ophiocordyceps camponoti-leonardi (nom. inval.)]
MSRRSPSSISSASIWLARADLDSSVKVKSIYSLSRIEISASYRIGSRSAIGSLTASCGLLPSCTVAREPTGTSPSSTKRPLPAVFTSGVMDLSPTLAFTPLVAEQANRPSAVRGQTLSLGRADGDCALSLLKAAVGADNNDNFHLGRILSTVARLKVAVERDDGALSQQDGHLVKRATEPNGPVTVVYGTEEEVHPSSRRKPGARRAEVRRFSAGRARNRSHQHLGPEEVLVREHVGFLSLGKVPVERLDQRLSIHRIGSASIHGVQVGNQAMAQLHKGDDHLARSLAGSCRQLPWLLANPAILSRVQSKDGRKDAELDPSGGEMIVPVAEHMAPNVVAPVAKPDVARHGRKLGLEIERLPGDDGVAREANRGIDAGQRRLRTLLPINPPKVDAVIAQALKQRIEIGIEKRSIGDVEGNRLIERGVDVHLLRYGAVLVLVRLDAVCRMVVERQFELPLVQLVDEGGRVREEFAVPGIASPAGTAVFANALVVDEMPVHVDDGDRERDAILLEGIHELEVRLGAILVVAAPEVAQRPARQQRLRPGNSVEGLNGLAIVMTVAEEVIVDPARPRSSGGDEAVISEEERVISKGSKAKTRIDARPDRNLAVDVIQRLDGAAQILMRLAVSPGGASVAEDDDE